MLDSSIVATSLYTIGQEFKETQSINWVALAYSLAYLSCAVLFARISDVIGRKWAFLASYVIFIAFSLGCGFAQSLQQLIACRALQGIGGSGLYSTTMIVFPELTPDHQKKHIASVVGLVIAVSGVLGPVLGGILTDYASWRWVFWINGPIGLVSIVIFWLTWPKEKYLPHLERRAWKEVDFLGSFLLIAASVLIVFPFQSAGENGDTWSQAIFIAPLILGIFCICALFAWEYYIDTRWQGKLAAAIPLVLLRNHVYSFATLATICMGFPYMMSVYAFPIYFQVVNGKSPLQAGLMLLPMLGGTAIGTTIGGAVNGKNNRMFETFVAACILMIIGCASETTASGTFGTDPKILGLLTFIGFGFGMSASASTMLANIESPVREHASAQGIIAQVRILGGSIGIAASSAILGVKKRTQLPGIVSPQQLANLAAVGPTLSPDQLGAIRRVYTDALRVDMIVCCGVLALGIVFSLGVYRRNRLSPMEQSRKRIIEERERKRRLAEVKADANVLVGQI
ncbi:MFS general substrate transporter [Diplogelasinospora grovesii]|uniref:MFS general substrate transporter n=1 Tax=Diplogelasinospora grovesii TaxID=303347 RepID=A0AAN6NFJ1_9PEZI|nr:MFS general substrate transporter [Diplogelasinospora grovesii]